MKTALLILAFLVHTVHSFSDTRAGALQLFNSARSSIAKNPHNPIANMYQLRYNDNLEKEIYEQLGKTGGCPDPVIIRAYPEYKVQVELHLNVRPKLLKDEKAVLKLVGGVGKTDMGYVETKCMVTGEEVHSYAFFTTNVEELDGPPGSQCPQGTRATSDGLCGPNYKRKEGKEGKFEKMGKTAGQLADQLADQKLGEIPIFGK